MQVDMNSQLEDCEKRFKSQREQERIRYDKGVRNSNVMKSQYKVKVYKKSC